MIRCPVTVVMAGDRRATAGNMIAQRDVDKVFRSDEFSAIGYAGAAGIGLELVRLFQVELEHYEKLEGNALSLDGKASRLASLVRGNIGAAMQGLVVVPLFVVGGVAGGRYKKCSPAERCRRSTWGACPAYSAPDGPAARVG